MDGKAYGAMVYELYDLRHTCAILATELHCGRVAHREWFRYGLLRVHASSRVGCQCVVEQ